MKRILVDVDGVVADLHTEWLRLYNMEYDDDLTVDKITSWDMQSFVKPECGSKIFGYLHDLSLYNLVNPIDGAVSSVRWLRRHGYDVRFVTSGVFPAKVQWLGEQGLLLGEYYMSSPDVIIAHDKSVINADIMIDDNYKNLETFQGKTKILFAQPWNNVPVGNYFRADDWPDVIQFLARGLS